MKSNEENEKIRNASGNITIKSNLVSFLYQLMRDEITAGKIEKIVQDSIQDEDTLYCNGWLAQYAEYLANRLLENKK